MNEEGRAQAPRMGLWPKREVRVSQAASTLEDTLGSRICSGFKREWKSRQVEGHILLLFIRSLFTRTWCQRSWETKEGRGVHWMKNPSQEACPKSQRRAKCRCRTRRPGKKLNVQLPCAPEATLAGGAVGTFPGHFPVTEHCLSLTAPRWLLPRPGGDPEAQRREEGCPDLPAGRLGLVSSQQQPTFGLGDSWVQIRCSLLQQLDQLSWSTRAAVTNTTDRGLQQHVFLTAGEAGKPRLG